LHLENAKNISVSASANGDDITRFIEKEVDRLISQRLLLGGKISPKFKRKIAHTLNDGAQGMFRWVVMSLETLQRTKFEPDFKKALGKLPSKLSDLYNIIHRQINETEIFGRNVAIRTLKWLLCAQRLLSVRELIAAVFVDYYDEIEPLSDSDIDSESKQASSLEDDSENEYNSVTESDIVRLCRNLVVVDSELMVFRFAHQSVQEYLKSREEYAPFETHSLALERCLYAHTFKPTVIPKRESTIEQNSIFQLYANIYWPVHYQKVEGNQLAKDRQNKLMDFLFQGCHASPSFTKWASAASELSWSLENGPLKGSLLGVYSVPSTPLFLACSFGVVSIMNDLSTHASVDWNQQNDLGSAGLHLAARSGHKAVADLLLEKGADLESADSFGWTPLLEAVRCDQEAIVKLLLERGANLESADSDGYTPLLVAVVSGLEAIVKLLLENGAEVEATATNGWTPLFVAVRYELEAIVKLLLEKGADLESTDLDGYTPLLVAVVYGLEAIVKLLLESGAEVEATATDGRTPLLLAVENGREAIVKLLLEKDADLESVDAGRRTPLLAAAMSGRREAMVKLGQH
jgi:ankyrin repeat protein